MRYSQAASFQAWCEELIDRYQYMWDAAINSGKSPTAATSVPIREVFWIGVGKAG